jgi:hypothetical protein
MKKFLFRFFAWSLLIGTAILSIIAGIKMGDNVAMTKFLIWSHGPGPMANWALYFISLSIGFCVYLLRGFEANNWKVSIKGILSIIGAAIIVLLFGITGLFIMAAVSVVVTTFLLRKKSDLKDI